MANRQKVRADAELIESEKWGVPSWTDTQGYPTAAKWMKMHPDKQRWEFLRRTKEYRQDWNRTQFKFVPPKEAPVSKFHVVRPFDSKALAAKYKMSTPLPPQQTYRDLPKGFCFIRPTPVGGYIVYPDCPIPFSEEWKNTKTDNRSVRDKKLAAAAKASAPSMVPNNWYETRVWVEFDLEHGIDDQIAHAKANLIAAANQVEEFMNALRRPDGKYSPDDYAPVKVRAKTKRGANKKAKESVEELPIISLLRILDAKNCGRTNQQIASGLAEYTGDDIDNSAVSKRFKVASQLWKIL